MGQKSPMEVQHAQKSMELTGGLGRVAVLDLDLDLPSSSPAFFFAAAW
jgi:hypothetical protein